MSSSKTVHYSLKNFYDYFQPLVSYDYGRIPQPNPLYQSPYATLPTQPSADATNPYTSIASPPTQHQQPLPPTNYPSMMVYPPKLDVNVPPPGSLPLTMQPVSYPMGATGGISSANLFSARQIYI